METRRCLVQGRVQGVGFRYYVLRSAEELGVRGTVRNRPDGSVEAVLQAEAREPIEALVDRLRSGPPAARVEAVQTEPLSTDERYGGMRVVR